MNPIRMLLRRLRALARRRRLEREMNDELRFHLEMQEAANRAAGMSADEARFAARRQFGHVDGVKETMRDLRGWVWLEQFGKDLRLALRSLARSPGFVAAAVPTLACGIGLCTTIFSVINPVLFRPLPFRDPDQLVFLNESTRLQGVEAMALGYADYLDWRRLNHVFTDIGLFLRIDVTLHGGEQPERIAAGAVTPGLFSVLGVQPTLGRGFTEADARAEAPRVVVLSHGLWQRRYGADPAVLGRSIQIDQTPCTVIGVMPPGFSPLQSAELWMPLIIADPAKTRGSHSFAGIARLRPGVTVAGARADLAAVCAGIAREFPAANTGVGPLVTPLREQLLGKDNMPLLSWLLLGAVGFVLAVACANVASLILARALGRQKEFAIRGAFGGSRWRAIRQLLLESLLVAAAAGVLGFALSQLGVRLVVALVPVEIPPWIEFGVDLRVCVFAAGISLLSCVLSGLAPAWRVSGTTLQEALDEAGRGATASRRHGRLRALLVAGEIALASLLLFGAGVTIRAVLNLERVDPGFESAGLEVFDLDLPLSRYGTPAACTGFYRTLLEQLGALHGVDAAAAVSHRPLGDRNYVGTFYLPGRPQPAPGEDPVGNFRAVTPGYFAAMGIPLLQGRDFGPEDSPGSPAVVIIDRTLARRYFPDTDSVGQVLHWGPDASAPKAEVIGVVGDVKHYALLDTASNTQAGIYLPHTQAAFNRMTIVLRLDRADAPIPAAAVRRVVRQLDAALPVPEPQPMAEILRRSVWTQRLVGKLFSGFSVLALALTAVGIAGMVAYTVSQRTHEIGVRVALGAREADVVRLVMRQGLALAAAGLLVGMVASTSLAHFLSRQLYAVSPLDPAPLAASAGLLGAVALLACYLPARRAANVDPIEALRTE